MAKGGDGGDNVGGLDPNPVVGEAWGGGIVDFAASLTVTNTTFTGNQAIGGNSAAGPGFRPRAAVSRRKSLLPRPSPT